MIIAKKTFMNFLRFLFGEVERKPYYKIRFRWWTPFDIDKFACEFGRIFDISFRYAFKEKGRIEIFTETRHEIRVKADTLYAFLSAYRAVLFQKKAAPFTERDRYLEEIILKCYLHTHSTPLF